MFLLCFFFAVQLELKLRPMSLFHSKLHFQFDIKPGEVIDPFLLAKACHFSVCFAHLVNR